jgi:hypothetical protein
MKSEGQDPETISLRPPIPPRHMIPATTQSLHRPEFASPRKGKWTQEEEEYANGMIFYFGKGALDIEPGVTLRSYLSERLYW